MKIKTIIYAFTIMVATVAVIKAQTPTPTPTAAQQAARNATREKMRALLDVNGTKVNITFKQSEKQPYNFVGTLSTGLKNADSFETVVSVSAEDTIHFRVFPHYNGHYVNLDRAKNSDALMRQMVRFSDANFMYWGADPSNDIFVGYNFTLESGFPNESIKVVLNSILKLDEYVGRMRPAIDGTEAK